MPIRVSFRRENNRQIMDQRTSSHFTWRRLQIRLFQQSVTGKYARRHDTKNARQDTDHPVVARSPRPRDFRGLRMPREASSLASAMTIYRLPRSSNKRNPWGAKCSRWSTREVSVSSSRNEVQVGISRCGGERHDWRRQKSLLWAPGSCSEEDPEFPNPAVLVPPASRRVDAGYWGWLAGLIKAHGSGLIHNGIESIGLKLLFLFRLE